MKIRSSGGTWGGEVSDWTYTTGIMDDPRLSQSQKEEIKKAATADPDAEVIGLDKKLRPVIKFHKKRGQVATYALLRNGDPTPELRPLKENW